MYKGFLIDLDGVTYRGDVVIKSSLDFVEKLREREIPYFFVTNNSTKRPVEFVGKLVNMGYPVDETQIVTSAVVTAEYIKNRNEKAKVYMIGMDGLENELEKRNIILTEENPDFVVMGLDYEVNYEKLAQATKFVSQGIDFIATNPDKAIPINDGYLPGAGSIIKVVSMSTGIEPIYIGKPNIYLLEYAYKKMNLSKNEIAIIGDNYYTDILSGINFGIDTIFVKTGIMTEELVRTMDKQPTYIVNNLLELL